MDKSNMMLPGIRKAAGFSLMELAVVLMIIGTLMSGVLVAVSQSTANARITNARAQLRDIEEALYGYAQANGRLPCPALATSSGREDLTAGACTATHGFVPIATLDFYGSVNSDGLLLDPWQNPVRYAVAYGSTAFTDATLVEAMFADPITTFVGQPTMLRVCEDSTCTGDIYSDDAPAVIFSMGANWATYTSANEQQNGGDGSLTVSGDNTYVMNNSRDFVSATYSEDAFDDQIIWLSPYIFFARLVEAGKLP